VTTSGFSSLRVIGGQVWGAVAASVAQSRSVTNRVISLAPAARAAERMLLSYRIEPFVLPPDDPALVRHTNFWMSARMAQIFLDFGYAVDVISHRNTTFVPHRHYAVVVDVRRLLERIAPALDARCLKIAHLDTAHMLYQDAAEARRLLMLQRRRGVTLAPLRFEVPNRALDHADCGLTTGNQWTIESYAYANKPIYRLPLPSPLDLPWDDEKDFEACRRRFLWFNTQGLVHKGLDLALEAFSDLPDYQLVVCGPIQDERAFVEVYRKELYDLPNIETVGWVRVTSPEFTRVAARCVAVVSTSCSEGGSGSTINCMHAGLIPVTTLEASVDVEDFGVMTTGDRPEDVRDAVTTLASRPASELRERARRAWEVARAKHTRPLFEAEYTRIVRELLGARGLPAGSRAC
jgi:glycosyltransferase involved in cell wall biosynthesis